MKVHLMPDLGNSSSILTEHLLLSSLELADLIVLSSNEAQNFTVIRADQSLLIYIDSRSNDRIRYRANTQLVEYENHDELFDNILCEIMVIKRSHQSFTENIKPYIQQIVSLSNDDEDMPIMYEVLARYQQEGKSVIQPSHLLHFLDTKSALDIFIALVEKIDLTNRSEVFSFNIPASLINDDVFFSQAISFLESEPLHFKKKMVIEITENFNEISINKENLAKLSLLVERVLIDDFGSNRANLDLFNQLRDINVGVKIDRSYFNDITHSGKEHFINQASSLLGLLKDCPFFVFEGVETSEQFEFLEDLQKAFPTLNIWLQGFFLSHPSPASEND